MNAENKENADRSDIKVGSSVDELAQRIVSAGVAKGDTALFLAQNWQKFVGAIVVVLLLLFLFNQYQSTQVKRAYDASQRFDTIIKNFDQFVDNSLVANPEDKKENKELSLIMENIKSIETTHSDLNYANFALLYKVVADLETKNFDSAKDILGKFDTAKHFTINTALKNSEVQENDLLEEIAALVKARLLLAEGKTEAVVIKQNLRSLVYGSRFVNIEALLMLYRLYSGNPEDALFTKETTEKIIATRPEIKEILTSALTAEGHSYQP